MDNLKYWYSKFIKTPMGLIAFGLFLLCISLFGKLVDIAQTYKVESKEKDKIIEAQTKIILDISEKKTRYETIYEINNQLKQEKDKEK